MSRVHEILVIGGGTAGTLHAALLNRFPRIRATLAYRSNSPVPEGGSIEVRLPGEETVGRLDVRHCAPASELKTQAYDGLLLCTPLHETLNALEETLSRKLLRPGAPVLSIASTLGLPESLQECLVRFGHVPSRLRIYSNFFAAARPDSDSRCIRISKVKQRVFFWESGGTKKDPSFWEALFCGDLETVKVSNPVELACRNINTWVHPPLVFQESCLKSIFIPDAPRIALYDLGTGGAVHPASMLEMGQYMLELEALFSTLGVSSWNTLRFLNDDNYPVDPGILSRGEIEAFPGLEPESRGEILLRRYRALRTGSVASIYPEKVSSGQDGVPRVPRIPMEDVFQLRSLIRHKAVDLPTPMIDLFLARYQRMLSELSLTSRAPSPDSGSTGC